MFLQQNCFNLLVTYINIRLKLLPAFFVFLMKFRGVAIQAQIYKNRNKNQMTGTAEGEELSPEVDHHLLFGNTSDSGQVMLTKNNLYAKSAKEK